MGRWRIPRLRFQQILAEQTAKEERIDLETRRYIKFSRCNVNMELNSRQMSKADKETLSGNLFAFSQFLHLTISDHDYVGKFHDQNSAMVCNSVVDCSQIGLFWTTVRSLRSLDVDFLMMMT